MQFTSMILSNVEISPGYFRMRLTAPPEFSAARAGQFVMVRVSAVRNPERCEPPSTVLMLLAKVKMFSE